VSARLQHLTDAFWSNSTPFRCVLERVRRYAKQGKVTILLEGESGTGKSFLARYLHDASPRARSAFQEVSLASLDDGVAGADLFGYVPGAFTDARGRRAGHFVSAHGGTLFLDEIGKCSQSIQRKLLRVIETGLVWPMGADRPISIDVRIITAANEDLSSLVGSGAFLAELHARLGCFRVRIPPLRERSADIPSLVDQFVKKHAADCGYNGTPPVVHPELLALLRRAPWPYNVRQLDGTVLRLLVDADGASVLTPDLCQDGIGEALELISSVRVPLSPDLIERAIESAGSKSAAARALGVHRSTLHRHIAEKRGQSRPPLTQLS
jgi:DNA-binding NtrC family response regulator